ncbi:tail fiber protein [Niabella sp. CC-SYL272]|uniref:phage tail protein n=1 Tax=Niabella agricola TaxID=2891571 RepID=UPI001F3A4900|nr:tail fiber protein [Niabella agricola]MCF3111449.1 tail fiber protein [Niabella agricola]
MNEPFLGMIGMFGFDFAPRNWASCNGQIIALRSNTALFALLGTTYGGDGVNTFALPNLAGRAPVGATGQGPGLSNYIMGQQAGVPNISLTFQHLPAHNHTINAFTDAGNTENPAGANPANTGKLDKEYRSSGTMVKMQPGMVGAVGSNTPFSIQQPFLVVNYCIALTGIFPARS